MLSAISEIHSIEMSIFSLWEQLPELDIIDTNKHNTDHYSNDYNVGPSGLPRAISYGAEEDEKHDRAVYFGWKQGDPPLNGHFKKSMDEKYGVANEPWDDHKCNFPTGTWITKIPYGEYNWNEKVFRYVPENIKLLSLDLFPFQFLIGTYLCRVV